MGNAMVNSIGSDTAILLTSQNVSNQTTGISSSDKDFNTILGQTREKTLQTSATNTEKSTAKNPTKEKMTDVSDKNKAVKDETASEKATEEGDSTSVKADTSKEQVNAVEHDEVKANSQEKKELDEETIEAFVEAVNEIFAQVAEILELSEEELQALLEDLNLDPVDLLNPDSMVQLALAAGGEDSVISIVMNENIYDNLHDLVESVEKELTALTEQTGLTQEKIGELVDQIKAFSMEEMVEKPEDLEMMPDTPEPVMETEKLTTTMEKTTQVEQTKSDMTQLSEKTTLETETQKLTVEVTEEKTENRQEYAQNQENNQEMTPFQQSLEHLQQSAETTDTVSDLTTDYAPTPEAILKQLADYVKVQSGKEMTEMEMQLHPASLGAVHISISNRGGTITAQITTQNETVKDAIESQVVNLKSNLEEQGVKVEAVEVSVASHQMERNLEQGGKDQKKQEENNKTDGIRRLRRTSINLNAWQDDEEEMDADEADAVRLTREMMQLYGNSMDLLA